MNDAYVRKAGILLLIDHLATQEKANGSDTMAEELTNLGELVEGDIVKFDEVGARVYDIYDDYIRNLLDRRVRETLSSLVDEMMEYAEDYPQYDDTLYDELSAQKARIDTDKNCPTPGTVAETIFTTFHKEVKKRTDGRMYDVVDVVQDGLAVLDEREMTIEEMREILYKIQSTAQGNEEQRTSKK